MPCLPRYRWILLSRGPSSNGHQVGPTYFLERLRRLRPVARAGDHLDNLLEASLVIGVKASWLDGVKVENANDAAVAQLEREDNLGLGLSVAG